MVSFVKKQISNFLVAGSIMPFLTSNSSNAMEKQVNESSTFYTIEGIDDVNSPDEKKTETTSQDYNHDTQQNQKKDEKQQGSHIIQKNNTQIDKNTLKKINLLLNSAIPANARATKDKEQQDLYDTKNSAQSNKKALKQIELLLNSVIPATTGAAAEIAIMEIYSKYLNKKQDDVTLPQDLNEPPQKDLNEPPQNEEQTSDEKVLFPWYTPLIWKDYKNGHNIKFWINIVIIITSIVMSVVKGNSKTSIYGQILSIYSCGIPYIGTIANIAINVIINL